MPHLLLLLLIGLAMLLEAGSALARNRPQVDANSASSAQLQTVPGIGPAVAQRILEARARGPFSDLEDLQARVRGVGPASARRLEAAGLRVLGVGTGRLATADRSAASAAVAPPVEVIVGGSARMGGGR